MHLGLFMSTVTLLVSAVCAVPGKLQLQKKGLQWDYQNDKIRGVNLGGWFVLEPYMTPSLFEVFDDIPVDEYHYTKVLGKDLAKQRLETHWKNWITEDDFKAIKENGLNTVRIPIGYWAFQLVDGDPYVQGQVKYLDQALEWCRQYGLYAWVDLHGAPGSQNGFDNSGLRDSYKFQEPNNQKVTLQVLKTISEKYGAFDYEDVVIGIELINEPLGPILNMDQLKEFYTEGYKQVRDVPSYNAVIVHDAFMQTPGYWDDFLPVDQAWNVVIDHHHYQVFNQKDLQKTIDEHIDTACQIGRDGKAEGHWNVIGEWSAALTDCAMWLNGVGHGARWSGDFDNCPFIDHCDNYVDIGKWSDEYRTNVRKYIEAQLDAYEYTGGWIYWAWKTENAVEWDFRRLTAAGVFPSPLTERQYPNQCGF
ncbi:glucan 1,3-beta-glucosidase [[Candida] anglica]|uniref:glucan 1,3-beta-glucosidase n=1 Tax=[Candida] anglica TaxID=148631 RepID=A0ABP0EF46_9ASCO